MKKILITGADSYIGSSVQKYLNQSQGYSIDVIDMKDGSWREKSFSEYDVVFHVAGIAHLEKKKAKELKEAYYSVNRDLAVEVATKSKQDGVNQFLFMSTASVYGDSPSVGKTKVIDSQTLPAPENDYGNSKLQAEQGILHLQSENFKIVVLRPPMIYGRGCKGNYPKLSSLAKKIKIFPYVNNQRSMLYIGNFCEFVKLVIDFEDSGVFYPQNKEYTNTADMVRFIANASGKKIHIINGFGWGIKLLGFFVKKVKKVFGNFTYSQELSLYRQDYQKFTLENSIAITEKCEDGK